ELRADRVRAGGKVLVRAEHGSAVCGLGRLSERARFHETDGERAYQHTSHACLLAVSIVPPSRALTTDEMTEVAEAESLIARHSPRRPAQRERLSACVDRVLAEDITAERDQPPFDRVTMDGIAIAYSGWAAGNRTFEIVGTQGAGARALPISGPAEC